MKKDKTDKFLDTALDKMFQAVGFTGFDKKFTEQKDWFRQKTWQPEQEAAFRDWFIAAARKQLRWSKRLAEEEFSWFNFMWGWKLDEKVSSKNNK